MHDLNLDISYQFYVNLVIRNFMFLVYIFKNDGKKFLDIFHVYVGFSKGKPGEVK